MSTAMGFVCQGLKNEFELAVVKEPSVFEPLKFHCISDRLEELERRREEKNNFTLPSLLLSDMFCYKNWKIGINRARLFKTNDVVRFVKISNETI